jgi:hypothetical protein
MLSDWEFLENHLRFFSSHEDTLMRGEFSTFGVDANFTIASAESEKEIISVLYQPQVVKVKKDKVNYIFNSCGKDDAYIESDKALKYELYDVFGDLTKKGIKCGVRSNQNPKDNDTCVIYIESYMIDEEVFEDATDGIRKLGME